MWQGFLETNAGKWKTPGGTTPGLSWTLDHEKMAEE